MAETLKCPFIGKDSADALTTCISTNCKFWSTVDGECRLLLTSSRLRDVLPASEVTSKPRVSASSQRSI